MVLKQTHQSQVQTSQQPYIYHPKWNILREWEVSWAKGSVSDVKEHHETALPSQYEEE
uniref:Uncharacterized protein n=1 Tax=Amphimedon queenslandica TaxID=400682 RepID=A0A1X7UEW4_AMPQE